MFKNLYVFRNITKWLSLEKIRMMDNLLNNYLIHPFVDNVSALMLCKITVFSTFYVFNFSRYLSHPEAFEIFSETHDCPDCTAPASLSTASPCSRVCFFIYFYYCSLSLITFDLSVARPRACRIAHWLLMPSVRMNNYFSVKQRGVHTRARARRLGRRKKIMQQRRKKKCEIHKFCRHEGESLV